MASATQHTIPEHDSRAEARAWARKQASGPLNASEQRDFNAWLVASRENQYAYDMARIVWDDLGQMAHLKEETGFAERLWGGLRTVFAPMVRPVPVLVAVGITAAMLVWQPWQLLAPEVTGLTTQTGEIKKIALADGSFVTLGARSSAEVNYSSRKRQIYLRSGEAFFDVKADAARPFIVTVGEADIQVLGTQFDVAYGPQVVRVAVQDGAVKVQKNSSVSVDAFGQQVLIAGQHAMVTEAGVTEPANISQAERAPGAWRRGRLVYDGASLASVVADANRYSEDKIIIADDSLASLQVTAAFKAGEINQLLRSLQVALPLVVEKTEKGQTLLVAQAKK